MSSCARVAKRLGSLAPYCCYLQVVIVDSGELPTEHSDSDAL